jgi:hypothetical protein
MPTKYPPAWPLNQALKAAKAIFEVHSKESFNADLLGDFLETTKTSRYPNAKLPTDAEALKAVLLKSIGINRETIPLWYTFVVDSFKAIAGVTSKVVDNVAVGDGPELEKPQSEPEMKTSTVFLPSGRKFSFSVEEGYTPDDMAFVQNLLNLFLKATQTTSTESTTKVKK